MYKYNIKGTEIFENIFESLKTIVSSQVILREIRIILGNL